MRYFLSASTLFIRGSFRAATSAIAGKPARVSTLLIHTVPAPYRPDRAAFALEAAVAGAGYGRDYLGLAATVPVQNLCVLQYDFVTAFIAAGTGPDKAPQPGASGIIICIGRGVSGAALAEILAAATEARSQALADCGIRLSAGTEDTIIVACEGEPEVADEEILSATAARVRAAVLQGFPEALRRSLKGTVQNRPSYFIFSRFKGEHWVEWTPEDCPYYPCHFEGQRCDFCYCPLYPCGDEELGQWSESANGGRVWNCARCTMIHEPEVADFLKQHPEATKDELKRVWKLQNVKRD